MTIACLHESLLSYVTRKAQLIDENTALSAQKTLLALSQLDNNAMILEEKNEIKNYFKFLYESDEALQENYIDYTEIPDFEDEIDKIDAYFQDIISELILKEEAIDAQILTNDVELKEIETYLESTKSTLTSNISNDFKWDIGG